MFLNKKDKEREKKFWNLKQLDRIEYMLEFKSIKDYFSPSSYLILNFLFLVNIILFLFATLFLIAFRSTSLIQIVPIILKLSILLLVISIFLDIKNIFSKNKEIFKLRKRFNLSSRD